MLRRQHPIHVAGFNDLAFAENRDPVADRMQAVEIMGYHKNRHCRSPLKGQDQLVEIAGADRIEARRWLVKKEDFRIERQRARERNALDHAAR